MDANFVALIGLVLMAVGTAIALIGWFRVEKAVFVHAPELTVVAFVAFIAAPYVVIAAVCCGMAMIGPACMWVRDRIGSMRLAESIGGELVRRRSSVKVLSVEPTCRVCGSALRPITVVVYCVRCDTPHHEECFEYAGCAIYGCGSKAANPDKTSLSEAPLTIAN